MGRQGEEGQRCAREGRGQLWPARSAPSMSRQRGSWVRAPVALSWNGKQEERKGGGNGSSSSTGVRSNSRPETAPHLVDVGVEGVGLHNGARLLQRVEDGLEHLGGGQGRGRVRGGGVGQSGLAACTLCDLLPSPAQLRRWRRAEGGAPATRRHAAGPPAQNAPQEAAKARARATRGRSWPAAGRGRKNQFLRALTVPMNSIPARCSSCRLLFSSAVHSLTCDRMRGRGRGELV